jgi:hypothetical protein
LALAQAVAATIAIIGAFGAVLLQHELENRRRRADKREDAFRVLFIAFEFVLRASRVVQGVSYAKNDPNCIETEVDRRRQINELSQALEAMNGISITELPTALAADDLMRARSALSAALFDESKHRETDGPGGQEVGAPWIKWAASLDDAARGISMEADKFRN